RAARAVLPESIAQSTDARIRELSIELQVSSKQEWEAFAQQYRQQRPDDPTILYADFASKLKSKEQAQILLAIDRIEEHVGHDPAYDSFRAIDALARNQLDEATTLAKSGIEAVPELVTSHIAYSTAMGAANRMDEAATYLRRLAATNPEMFAIISMTDVGRRALDSQPGIDLQTGQFEPDAAATTSASQPLTNRFIAFQVTAYRGTEHAEVVARRAFIGIPWADTARFYYDGKQIMVGLRLKSLSTTEVKGRLESAGFTIGSTQLRMQ
ncbi:MAG: hypothetical protein KDA51_20845, partial [Planctomycetales bacterium]|nr:hypothetical protein [Planctomycetales bacterium]